MKERVVPTLITLVLALLPLRAQADNLFGEFQRLPDDIERGFSLGADFGLQFVQGHKDLKNPGFVLTFITGYDIIKYLSVEGIATLGINEITPPAQGGGLNLFQFNLAAKAQYPLGRWYPFFEAGPGITYLTPSTVSGGFDPTKLTGKNKKFGMLFAGGFEYYTYLRHYSLYVKGTYHYVKLPINTMALSVGVKYTF